jgi:hypothetical protein
MHSLVVLFARYIVAIVKATIGVLCAILLLHGALHASCFWRSVNF